jgi:proteasome lid subunit RPN8/RPN11
MAKTIKLMRDASYNVYILPDARAKMEMYCELCEKEIGWLGFVKKFPGTGYLITDVVLLKQEVHATTTEIDPQALLEFWGSTPVEQQVDIKLWGHSHVNMSPTPSGQDDSQMDYFKDGNDWFIRLITNKKGDMNITIYDYANGIEIHDDVLYTYNPKRAELRTAIEAEIKEKVKEKTYTPARTTVPTYNSSRTFNTPSKKNRSTTQPMFNDIEVKYVSKFDDVLNDPNYWQDILAANAV